MGLQVAVGLSLRSPFDAPAPGGFSASAFSFLEVLSGRPAPEQDDAGPDLGGFPNPFSSLPRQEQTWPRPRGAGADARRRAARAHLQR